jgi:hypothetical protein
MVTTANDFPKCVLNSLQSPLDLTEKFENNVLFDPQFESGVWILISVHVFEIFKKTDGNPNFWGVVINLENRDNENQNQREKICRVWWILFNLKKFRKMTRKKSKAYPLRYFLRVCETSRIRPEITYVVYFCVLNPNLESKSLNTLTFLK